RSPAAPKSSRSETGEPMANLHPFAILNQKNTVPESPYMSPTHRDLVFDVPDQTFDAVLGLSILHLLEDKEEAIAKVHRMLKPGGVFVTSTACIGDTMKFFKVIGPIGKSLGLMPYVSVFTTKELEAGLTDAGFEIDHQWQPGKGKSVFIVAKKAG
ncbi:MAG: class I SAM-dependent methyltransferase, partial [Hyphomicrobiales bacterium]|nr:class I SAM-dependent methyltransferase [Hyphomicrobiales bacterium]